MKASLHVGPQGCGAPYLCEAAHRNAARLAEHGVYPFPPREGVRIPRALNDGRADIALQQFDRLAAASRGEGAPNHANPVYFCAYEEFASALAEQAPAYEATFSVFVAELAKRGYEVELVFVERDIEDIVVAHALRRAALGDLAFVTSDPAPYLRYLRAYSWLKSFYFRGFKVLHLDYRHLTRDGDMLDNFLQLAYRRSIPALEPGPKGLLAPTDADVAKGVVTAPFLHWIEQFETIPGTDLLEAPLPLEPRVRGESWQSMVGDAALLRESVRACARRAIAALYGEAVAHK